MHDTEQRARVVGEFVRRLKTEQRLAYQVDRDGQRKTAALESSLEKPACAWW